MFLLEGFGVEAPVSERKTDVVGLHQTHSRWKAIFQGGANKCKCQILKSFQITDFIRDRELFRVEKCCNDK